MEGSNRDGGTMRRLLASLVLCWLIVGVGPASAFWRRSQVSMCSDAVSDAERTRHRCWELDPYIDPGWPALGLAAGRFGAPRGYGREYVPLTPPLPVYRKGITRRLG